MAAIMDSVMNNHHVQGSECFIATSLVENRVAVSSVRVVRFVLAGVEL